MDAFKPYLAKVATGAALAQEEARAAFDALLSGEVTPAQAGGFLMALRVRGEALDEIVGAASAMRARMLEVEAPANAVDIVGTGGDHSGSYNISTLAAFVVAGCGVPVAKHGNRALSSRSGAADVLAALGVNIDADMELVKRALWEANLCFLMAPRHHGAMRHVGPTRVELGTRTIFNLLGPLSNPAGTRRQLVGVFSEQWVEPLAAVSRMNHRSPTPATVIGASSLPSARCSATWRWRWRIRGRVRIRKRPPGRRSMAQRWSCRSVFRTRSSSSNRWARVPIGVSWRGPTW